MSKKAKKDNKTLEKNLKKKIKEFSALYDIGKSITSTLHLDEVLKLITRKAAKVMDASSCSIRLLDETGQELILRSSCGMNNRYYEIKKSLKIGESIAGRVVKKQKPYIINDVQKERHYKYPYLAKQKGLRSLVTVPLVQRNRIAGVLSIYSRKPGKYTDEDASFLSMLASQAAIAIENARLYEQAEMSYLNTIKTLSNIIDAKDSHTYGHSERVMEHSIRIAEELGLSDHDKEILKYASLLHDIGKIGIDVGILRKPSKLTDEEWKIMVMHPVLGSGIVEQIGFLNDLAPIILRHHERCDGRGYPGKLKKKKIPLGARILAITDAYESMVSDRPYRKGLSLKKAKEELLKNSGSQFDSELVKIFVKMLDRKKK
ncbi:MAG: GAF domain-containing protein [Candidatus Omnitrophica bacterium]|nr:GAF domain-containing protein [Candidatus Omnitrophota bacterium]MBU1933342.1 GAF domain-containing protein [Candidatus Omnitrophota bacterium]